MAQLRRFRHVTITFSVEPLDLSLQAGAFLGVRGTPLVSKLRKVSTGRKTFAEKRRKNASFSPEKHSKLKWDLEVRTVEVQY